MNLPMPFIKRDSNRRSIQDSVRQSSMSINEKKSCVNIEELMQFEEARRRTLSQVEPSIKENPFSEFVSHRVFVNQIDTFNGSHIVRYLSNIKRTTQTESDEEYGESNKGKIQGGEDQDDEDQFDDESTESTAEEYFESETYQIIGSLEFFNNPNASDISAYKRPEGIFELLDNEKKMQFLDKLLTCGFIIYDITSDLYCHPKQVEEAKWVLESLVKRLEMYEKNKPKEFKTYAHCRCFILISTLLTWARTKPINPEEPGLPFTERDFRKRKPHPNYKIHCELEKKVIEMGKKYPNNLKTIVIGSGIPYGHEEDILHFLFKMAWEDAPFLPIFKPGNYLIPLIHVDALASVVQMVMSNFPSKHKYIIATEPHLASLKQIVKLLAKNLSNGKTKLLDKEEAFLIPDIKQRNYDMLTANINIIPGFILDHLVKSSVLDSFQNTIEMLISQYKTARKLSAVKIFIHGPPASGKTLMAKKLSAYYDIPYLSEESVVEEIISTLRQKVEEMSEKAEKEEKEKIIIQGDEADEAESEKGGEDGDGEDLEALKQRLKEIEDNLEKNDNKLDDEFVIRFFKEKLSSKACNNKGYVIDGYPETMEQTKLLYAPLEDETPEGEGEEEQGGDISRLCNTSIMPAYVESLDASDEYLINKLIKLPETMTLYEEHDMCRRLTEFRALNTEDNTPLIFYDEMEVHPMIYNMENDTDIQMKATFGAIINHIGPPRNYGKTPTIEDIFNEIKEENERRKLECLKFQRDEAKKFADEKRQNFEKWMFLKNQELDMEEKALLLVGMPLRHYLMKYIFPCLTRGLVEVARVRPDDPLDFLSEFLFRENPEGKMFQPNYNEIEEKFAAAVKEYDTTPGRETSNRSKKSFSTDKSPKSDAISQVTGYKCSYVSSSSKKSSKSGILRPVGQKTGASKSRRSTKSQISTGICTCQKSPSLSTCSSDRTPSTLSSCHCSIPEPCEPCDVYDGRNDTGDQDRKGGIDPCKCPCEVALNKPTEQKNTSSMSTT